MILKFNEIIKIWIMQLLYSLAAFITLAAISLVLSKYISFDIGLFLAVAFACLIFLFSGICCATKANNIRNNSERIISIVLTISTAFITAGLSGCIFNIILVHGE